MSSSFLNALFWIAVVMAVVGQVAVLYSTFVAVPAARRDGTAPQVESSRPGRILEAVWAWLPVPMLVLVLALTWSAVKSSQGLTWRLVVPEAGAEPVVLPVAPSAAVVPATSAVPTASSGQAARGDVAAQPPERGQEREAAER